MKSIFPWLARQSDIKYYGQEGEDALLWQIFKSKRDGFFIDAGAFDGKYLSNSFSFELEGWSGICVEAIPEFFEMCRRNRPRSISIHAACVAPGQGSTVQFEREPLGLLSGIRAHETPDLEGRYRARGMMFPGFTRIEVPARTLDEILAEHPPPASGIDFLSIDVEGTELDVLRGFDNIARVVLVEANTAAQETALRGYMAARGYIAARMVGRNLFFVRNAADAAILKTASFTVRTEALEHPLGGRVSLPHATGKKVRFRPVTG
jgi:FkbM family methyltransferase